MNSNDYKDFTDEQKAILCLYPEGILYGVDKDNSIYNIPVGNLISKIKIALLGEDNDNFHLGDALIHLNIDDFNDIIGNVYDDYKKESNTSKK